LLVSKFVLRLIKNVIQDRYSEGLIFWGSTIPKACYCT